MGRERSTQVQKPRLAALGAEVALLFYLGRLKACCRLPDPTTGPLIHTIGLLLEAPSPPRVLLAHTHRPLTSVLKGSGCMDHLFAAAEKRGVSAHELYARREGVAFVSLIEMTRGESMEARDILGSQEVSQDRCLSGGRKLAPVEL